MINFRRMFNRSDAGKYLFIASIIIVSAIPFLLSSPPLSFSRPLYDLPALFRPECLSARARNSAARYLTDGRVWLA